MKILCKRKNIYLDYNILFTAIKHDVLEKYLLNTSNTLTRYLYSPAHIEEIYKSLTDENFTIRSDAIAVLCLLDKITNSVGLTPTLHGIMIRRESLLQCLYRVHSTDTREKVQIDGVYKFYVDKTHKKALSSLDKTITNLSNADSQEIWGNRYIVSLIEDFNKNADQIISMYNQSDFVQEMLYQDLDLRLPQSFRLKSGNYQHLKKSHTELEYSIEILFRILNYCGYNSEKAEKTAVSAIHDVSHSIYGTKANYLVTADKKFYKKCSAIYEYLGVPTKTILTSNDTDKIIDEISKVISGNA